MIGTCRHCGQSQEVANAVTKAEADAYASINCSCKEAEAEANLILARDELRKMTGPEAKENGFKPLDEETVEFLETVLDAVGEGLFTNATINTGDGTLTFKIKTDGKITINRKKSINIKFEL